MQIQMDVIEFSVAISEQIDSIYFMLELIYSFGASTHFSCSFLNIDQVNNRPLMKKKVSTAIDVDRIVIV